MMFEWVDQAYTKGLMKYEIENNFNRNKSCSI